ncbi:7tm odorant receptor domain-containing protein [Phthorimaea operculella]|nr:7tm odorant receptor domain-containing protein [Phthorimaea operculella]
MAEKYLLEQSFKKIDYTMRWTGMLLNKKAGKLQKYYALYIFNFIMLNLDVAGSIYWFVVGAMKGESLTSLTYVAPCITISLLGNIKSICFLVYGEQVDKLMTILKDLEVKAKKWPAVNERKEIIDKETKFLHLVLKLLNFFNWVVIIAFPLVPLSLTIMSYVQSHEFNPLLPFLIQYPFNAYDPRIWPVMYVKQIWSEMIVILELCGVDFTFFITSSYIRIQFQLLAYEVGQLVKQHQNLCEDAAFKAKFEDIVNWHQQVIYSVELLEVIYCKSTLFNFVSSSVLICLTGFNVTTIDDQAFVISFLSFLFMSLLQIYSLCFFGDMLMSSSKQLADAVYKSQWYLADAKTAKLLFMIQMRSQKACKLTASGFADVNLNAFTKVLSTAWSYFTLLRTIED